MENFIQLVNRMRIAQKTYFEMRTQQNLILAKALEKEVDRQISKELITLPQERYQKSIFDQNS